MKYPNMKQMTQTLWFLLFQINWDLSSRRKYGSNKSLFIIRCRYTWMLSWGSQKVIFSRTIILINSASYEYTNRSANKGAHLISRGLQHIVRIPGFQKLHRCCLLETRHILCIHFRVPVCTIRMIFNKIVLQMTEVKVS